MSEAYERAYGDGASRQAMWRSMREDADRARGRVLMAEARARCRRDRVFAKMQPIVDLLEAHLREALNDARRQGDNGRRILLEGEIDELHRLANEAVHEASR